MRQSILSHQLQDLEVEAQTISKREGKLRLAADHLRGERNKLQDRIKLLQEEMELVDRHLEMQASKLMEVQEQESSIHSQMNLIRETINALQQESEKLKLLAQGVSGNR